MGKIKITRDKHLINFQKDDEKVSRLRYNLKEKTMEKEYVYNYKTRDVKTVWYPVKQQYGYFRNFSLDDLEFDTDAKFKKLVLDSKQMNGNCSSLSSFISRLENVLVYENFINEGVRYKVDYNYRRWDNKIYKHFQHGLEEYDKNVIKFFKLTDYEVDNSFEQRYFDNPDFYKSSIQIIMSMDINPEEMKKVLETIIYNRDEFNELVNTYKYDTKALFNYIINYLTKFENLRISESLTLLRDYYSMASRIGRDVKKYPKYLKSMHDIIMANYNAYKKEYDEELFMKLMKVELEFEGKDFIIINPKGPKDIISEGTSLNHCVSSYVDSILSGRTYIFFLREKKHPERSLVTLELKENKITQAKGSYNRAITKEEKEFLETYVKKVKIEIGESL